MLHHIYTSANSILLALSNSFSLSFLFFSYLVSFAKSDMPPSPFFLSYFHALIDCLSHRCDIYSRFEFPTRWGLDFPFTLWQHQFSSPMRWCESNCTFSSALSVNVILGWNSQWVAERVDCLQSSPYYIKVPLINIRRNLISGVTHDRQEIHKSLTLWRGDQALQALAGSLVFWSPLTINPVYWKWLLQSIACDF